MIMATQDDLTALIQAHRIGHLATADGTGAPHLVPICFTYVGGFGYAREFDVEGLNREIRLYKIVPVSTIGGVEHCSMRT